ncbi:MAG: MSMEG_0568 family radical SAM protein [Desulfobacteraceae bacterium]|nr:MSMEG_0568 family radical SAM protein [Desulfobacteraceae bacterium]
MKTEPIKQPTAGPVPLPRLITEIQSLGVRVPPHISGRKGGAGPAEGRAMLIENVPVNVPISNSFVADSPYALTETCCGYVLTKDGADLKTVDIVADPRFYKEQVSEGVTGKQTALLHGRDCLATTVLQTCVHWKTHRQCRFCGTELSLAAGGTTPVKRPSDLARLTASAVEKDGIRHVVLTSGTADPPGAEIPYLAECVRTIKSATNIPVHVQFAPPPEHDGMIILKQAGVDTVGIHIESFEASVLERMAPAKAAIGRRRYEAAWEKAVGLFGVNQVSSFIIAGLGESPQSIVWGSEILADMGVYPFVVPLRPIPGSQLAGEKPPAPDIMHRIYEAVAGILKKKGLSASACRAGCVPCGACSALGAYEGPMARLLCHRARTASERSAAMAIRHQVFVEEQGLFEHSDEDADDARSTLLVAKINTDVVGTVRVYPTGNGQWVGGRLAVHTDHRVYKVGASLVREAMKRVKKEGCRRFTANIQEANIRFFQRLGWKPDGEMKIYQGEPHQLMVADLGLVPDDL